MDLEFLRSSSIHSRLFVRSLRLWRRIGTSKSLLKTTTDESLSGLFTSGKGMVRGELFLV